METKQEWKFNPYVNDSVLNSLFFLGNKYPKEILNIIAFDYINNKHDKLVNDKLRFHYCAETNSFDFADYLIQKYFDSDLMEKASCNKLNLKYLIDGCKKAIHQLNFIGFVMKQEKVFIPINEPINEPNIYAKAILIDDFNGNDTDPYETAGGYRNWFVPKDTFIDLVFNEKTLLFDLVSNDVHILVDHYNNNFGGITVNNGTTTYEMFERIETRTLDSVRLDSTMFPDSILYNQKNQIFKLTTFDYEKLLEFIRNNFITEVIKYCK